MNLEFFYEILMFEFLLLVYLVYVVLKLLKFYYVISRSWFRVCFNKVFNIEYMEMSILWKFYS